MQASVPSSNRLFDEILEESPTTLDELEQLEVYQILLIVGAYIALGIGILHFVLSLGSQPLPSLLFKLFINLTVGFLLLVSFHRIANNGIQWQILVIIFSIISVSLGGIVGLLAGTFSLLGGLLSFLYR